MGSLKIQKSDPKGIDVVIGKIQSYLFDGLSFVDHTSYGRAYKNETNNGLVAEVYTSTGNYKEVYFNDKVNAQSFFLADDKVNFDSTFSTNVSFIMQCKLNKLFPSITHRADEELHNKICILLKNNPYCKLTSYETGLKNVYNGLYFDQLKYTDIGSFHFVKFNLEVNFSTNC